MMGDCEDMSFVDFIIKHFFTIMLVDILIFVLLIGIFNEKMAYMYAVFGIIVLCVIDRYEEKIIKMVI
jgi:hypothetical protein